MGIGRCRYNGSLTTQPYLCIPLPFLGVQAAPGLQQLNWPNGSAVHRLYTVRGLEVKAGRQLQLGVFPLDRFLNGHTLFVQVVNRSIGTR